MPVSDTGAALGRITRPGYRRGGGCGRNVDVVVATCRQAPGIAPPWSSAADIDYIRVAVADCRSELDDAQRPGSYRDDGHAAANYVILTGDVTTWWLRDECFASWCLMSDLSQTDAACSPRLNHVRAFIDLPLHGYRFVTNGVFIPTSVARWTNGFTTCCRLIILHLTHKLRLKTENIKSVLSCRL